MAWHDHTLRGCAIRPVATKMLPAVWHIDYGTVRGPCTCPARLCTPWVCTASDNIRTQIARSRGICDVCSLRPLHVGLRILVSGKTIPTPLHHIVNCSISASRAKYQPVSDNALFLPITNLARRKVKRHICRSDHILLRLYTCAFE